MNIKSYRDLIVWQKAMDLCVDIHTMTRSFPKEEIFCLTAQLRRATTSIPSNIAEGNGRRSTAEYIHYLSISRGSLNETETQLTLAMRFGYITEATHEQSLEACGEVGRMINALMDSLQKRKQ